ncbi:MAG: hypothetical protein AMXMBFR34_04470 [Myxococcaceae bacterium]
MPRLLATPLTVMRPLGLTCARCAGSFSINFGTTTCGATGRLAAATEALRLTVVGMVRS